MTEPQTTPIVISTAQLSLLIEQDGCVIVDMQSAEHYVNAHIPGAVNLDYAKLVVNDGQAGGLLPAADAFAAVARQNGIMKNSHVVVYDAEGGAAASRLIWSLHVFGHVKTSLLDGGFRAWIAENRAIEGGVNQPADGDFQPHPANNLVIDGDELLARLGENNLTVLDARSQDEYNGTKVLAMRGGHIPGAIHMEWTDALDINRNLQLKPNAVLEAMLEQRGIEKNQEVVVHCQTHRRSSLSYVMLKHLGYENVRGYHGSWSEWGNRTDTPVE